MASFRERLQEIQTDLATAARRRVRLDDAALGLHDEAEQRRTARARLAEGIEELMGDFAREFEEFSLRRYFYEGELCLELIAREVWFDRRGRLRSTFSRVFFQLVARPEDGHLVQHCKLTVWGRELPGESLCSHGRDPQDLEQTRHFAEHQLLRFAQAWFRQQRLAGAPAA